MQMAAVLALTAIRNVLSRIDSRSNLLETENLRPPAEVGQTNQEAIRLFLLESNAIDVETAGDIVSFWLEDEIQVHVSSGMKSHYCSFKLLQINSNVEQTKHARDYDEAIRIISILR